jgi:hypothetical protein
VSIVVATIVISAPNDAPPITIIVLKINESFSAAFFGGLPNSDCEIIQRPF